MQHHPPGVLAPPAGQAVLPEIQATLARPPATVQTMMKGGWVGGWGREGGGCRQWAGWGGRGLGAGVPSLYQPLLAL